MSVEPSVPELLETGLAKDPNLALILKSWRVGLISPFGLTSVPELPRKIPQTPCNRGRKAPKRGTWRDAATERASTITM